MSGLVVIKRGLSIDHVILFFTFCAYFTFSIFVLFRGITWQDEVTYLVKSIWYVNGTVKSYSDWDATWYMPLFFYQLGWIQDLFGTGHIVGRSMSIMLGAVGAIVLFFIVKRLSGHNISACLAVLIYICTPTTAYYFSTATPYAAVALFHLIAVWLVISSEEGELPTRAFILGALLAILFFYRQNMILAASVLAPLFVFNQPQRRMHYSICIAAGALAVTAVILMIFPSKIITYALRLPIIAPIIFDLGWYSSNLQIIHQSTVDQYSLSFSVQNVTLYHIWNWFLIPYAGTVCAVLASLILFPRKQRRFLVWPVYFLFLAITHYLGSIGYLQGAIVAYMNYFVFVGAICAGLALQSVLHRLPQGRINICALVVAIVLLGMNVVSGPAYNLIVNQGSAFPWSSLRLNEEASGLERIAQYRSLVLEAVPKKSKVLVIHNDPALTYAVADLGHSLPPQVFDPHTHYRRLKTGLSEKEKVRALTALESESLWSDDIMERWIKEDYDIVIYETGATYVQQDALNVLEQNFKVVNETALLGTFIKIYVRFT